MTACCPGPVRWLAIMVLIIGLALPSPPARTGTITTTEILTQTVNPAALRT